MRAWVRESDVIQADRATHVLSLLLDLLHLLVVAEHVWVRVGHSWLVL